MPLEGLKILDISSWLTGAGATALLADLGADVIKVEHPLMGDATRTMTFTPQEEERGIVALYELANRNKRGIAVARHGIDPPRPISVTELTHPRQGN